jgi:pyridoxal phosphate enzyme (YggS family)
VQEALDKMEQVHVPVRWHLIGHLQRNKAKHALRFSMVHSVDSARLADALDAEARRAGQVLPVLLQVNVTGEASKGGYAAEELPREAERLQQLQGLQVSGVMTMARFEASESELRATFSRARAALGVLQRGGHQARELSMGMSGDYLVAVEEGATLVRLGTILFGAR